MEFITKKLDFSNQTITEMKLNSKKFYNLIKKRRSVRDFKKQIIDNQWKINDEDLKDEWFDSKMKFFKHYGRDMETLFSK